MELIANCVLALCMHLKKIPRNPLNVVHFTTYIKTSSPHHHHHHHAPELYELHIFLVVCIQSGDCQSRQPLLRCWWVKCTLLDDWISLLCCLRWKHRECTLLSLPPPQQQLLWLLLVEYENSSPRCNVVIRLCVGFIHKMCGWLVGSC